MQLLRSWKGIRTIIINRRSKSCIIPDGALLIAIAGLDSDNNFSDLVSYLLLSRVYIRLFPRMKQFIYRAPDIHFGLLLMVLLKTMVKVLNYLHATRDNRLFLCEFISAKLK